MAITIEFLQLDHHRKQGLSDAEIYSLYADDPYLTGTFGIRIDIYDPTGFLLLFPLASHQQAFYRGLDAAPICQSLLLASAGLGDFANYIVGTTSAHIRNDILGTPRAGSALQLDDYHAFSDIVDNYDGYATQTNVNNGTLYRL